MLFQMVIYIHFTNQAFVRMYYAEAGNIFVILKSVIFHLETSEELQFIVGSYVSNGFCVYVDEQIHHCSFLYLGRTRIELLDIVTSTKWESLVWSLFVFIQGSIQKGETELLFSKD